MSYIFATSITFNWKEGDQDDDMPKSFPTWRAANEQLRQWARHAPRTGGYDKTDFTITWSDGDSYTGRFDLQYQDALRHTKFGLLGDHIYEHVSFYAGIRRPAHITEAQYAILAGNVEAAEYREFLSAHLLRDAFSDTDYWWEFDTAYPAFDTVVYEPTAPDHASPFYTAPRKFAIGPAAYGSTQMVAKMLLHDELVPLRFFDSADPCQNYADAKTWIRANFPNATLYGEPYPCE